MKLRTPQHTQEARPAAEAPSVDLGAQKAAHAIPEAFRAQAQAPSAAALGALMSVASGATGLRSYDQPIVDLGVEAPQHVGNPYLDAYKMSMSRLEGLKDWSAEWLQVDIEQSALRRDLRARFAYAIPCDEAITRLVQAGPILEIGAGLGYWARLVRDNGGDILAVDRDWSKNSQKLGFNPENRFHEDGHEPWTDVILVEDCVAVVKANPGRTLFVCWPPFVDADAPEPVDGWFDAECLKAFQGDTFILVGEPGGCTGSPSFERELGANWKCSEFLELPTWPRIHDGMYVYQRRWLDSTDPCHN